MSSFFSGLFLADPILRRWTLERLRKRWPADEGFVAGRPPYLPDLPGTESATVPDRWRDLPGGAPVQGLVSLSLPGQKLEVEASDTRSLFVARGLDQDAVGRGLQAFTWLALDPGLDPDWVTALWQGWAAHHGLPDAGSPAWTAAVAARRALNMLDYAERVGVPLPKAENLARLAAHAAIIVNGLDWREDGSHDTRLIVEGAALARLGMVFDLPQHAEAGFTLLAEEARRQFGSSGIISQGSTHHHLLAVQDYLGVWLEARRLGHAAAAGLESLVRRLLAPVSALCINGQLPWVGDLAADFPPAFSLGLLPDAPAALGWLGQLPEADRAAVLALRGQCRQNDLDALRADGWLRQTVGPWSGLWHAFPSGWSPVKGYGHADLGSCTLHYESVPVFIDPGNGAEGAEGRAYRSAAAHGGLTLNDIDPYPRNRAVYSEAFRRDAGGKPPLLQAEYDGVSCVFEGYSHCLGHNEVQRRWRVEGSVLRIHDVVNGTGRVRVARRLITELHVTVEDGAAILTAPTFRLKVSAEVPAVLQPGKVWTAWGECSAANAITFAARRNLPWQGGIVVEPLPL